MISNFPGCVKLQGRGVIVALSSLVSISLVTSSHWTLCSAQENGSWVAFEKCPVMVERTLEIPALDRGFLKVLHVELNQTITASQLLAELDTDLVELELRLARLEYTQASELAMDDEVVNFHQKALEKVEVDLASYLKLGKSASESEIREKTFDVVQATYALQIAKNEKRRAAAEVKRKAGAVEAAELRLTRRRIVAPEGGVVTAIKVNQGQAVESGQPILEIENLEYVLIDCFIPIQQLRAENLNGSEVRVDVGASTATPLRLSGKITSHDQRVSAGGTVRAHARVKNIKRDSIWALLPGDEVTMYVAKGHTAKTEQAQATIQPTNLR
jgi:multidrug efflux pump subunit AcrA (membrane-fusion protein)